MHLLEQEQSMKSTETVCNISMAAASLQETSCISNDPESDNDTTVSFEVENSESSSSEESSCGSRFPSLNVIRSPKTSPTVPDNLGGYSVHPGAGPLSVKFRRINVDSPILEFKHQSTSVLEREYACPRMSDLAGDSVDTLQDSEQHCSFTPSVYDAVDLKEPQCCQDSNEGTQPEHGTNNMLHNTSTSTLGFSLSNKLGLSVILPVDLVVPNASPCTSFNNKETVVIHPEQHKYCVQLTDTEVKDGCVVGSAAAATVEKETANDRDVPKEMETTAQMSDFKIDNVRLGCSTTTIAEEEHTHNGLPINDIKNGAGLGENDECSTDRVDKFCDPNIADDCISSLKVLFPSFTATWQDIDCITSDLVKPECISSTEVLLGILDEELHVNTADQCPPLAPTQSPTEVMHCKPSDNTNDIIIDCLPVEPAIDMFVTDSIISDKFLKCEINTDNGQMITIFTEVGTMAVENPTDLVTCEMLPQNHCDTIAVPIELNNADNSAYVLQSQDLNTDDAMVLGDDHEETHTDHSVSHQAVGIQCDKPCGSGEEVIPCDKTIAESNKTFLGLDFNPITNLSGYQQSVADAILINSTNTVRPDPVASVSIILNVDAEVSSLSNTTKPIQLVVPAGSPCSETAGRSIVYSPLLFSDEEDYENVSSENNLSGPYACGDQSGSKTIEQRRLKQIQESLVGVFPPPSVTMPRLGIDDMLKYLKEGDALLKSRIVTGVQDEDVACNRMKQAVECKWPDVKFVVHPDIYYNNGLTSEKFESLLGRYSQRYVGCETASTCNVWSSSSIANSSANTRNKRLGAGPSPGRRLSHLARRRRAFSKDNLIAHNNVPKSQSNAIAERRQIVVNKKTDFRPSNSHGQTAQGPALGARPMTYKRALFQSPDNVKKTSQPKPSSASKRRTEMNRTAAPSYKRALFASGGKQSSDAAAGDSRVEADGGRRRGQGHGHTTGASTSKRKLQFDASDDDTRERQEPAGASMSAGHCMSVGRLKRSCETCKKRPCVRTCSATSVLSSAHKKKLLWAVAEALRGKGINIRHALFKSYATSLARICRTRLSAAMKATDGSTSEIMLRLANQHIDDVMGVHTS